jgi:hypothetical protein
MAVAFRVPGLRQLLSTLAAVKWVMVFVLAYCVMKHRRGYLLLAVTVLLEFGLGLWVFSLASRAFSLCFWSWP